MKKVIAANAGVAVIALFIMCVNTFLAPLSDTVVRITGIVLLVDIAVAAFLTVRMRKK